MNQTWLGACNIEGTMNPDEVRLSGSHVAADHGR